MKFIATLMRLSNATNSELIKMPRTGIMKTESSNAPNAAPRRSELYKFAALAGNFSFNMEDPKENCIPVTTDIISVRNAKIECNKTAGKIIRFNNKKMRGRRVANKIITSCRDINAPIEVFMIFSRYKEPIARPLMKTVIIIPV